MVRSFTTGIALTGVLALASTSVLADTYVAIERYTGLAAPQRIESIAAPPRPLEVTITALMERFDVLTSVGDYEGAFESIGAPLTELLEREPSDFEALDEQSKGNLADLYNNYGFSLLGDGKIDLTIRYLEQGLSLKESTELHYNMGTSLFLVADRFRRHSDIPNAVSAAMKALTHYRKSLALETDAIERRWTQGEINHVEGFIESIMPNA